MNEKKEKKKGKKEKFDLKKINRQSMNWRIFAKLYEVSTPPQPIHHVMEQITFTSSDAQSPFFLSFHPFICLPSIHLLIHLSIRPSSHPAIQQCHFWCISKLICQTVTVTTNQCLPTHSTITHPPTQPTPSYPLTQPSLTHSPAPPTNPFSPPQHPIRPCIHPPSQPSQLNVQ